MDKPRMIGEVLKASDDDFPLPGQAKGMKS
jgi:hypothetical protein